jgi:hypothetical protein
LLGSLQQRKQYRHNFFRDDLAVPVLLDHEKLLTAGQADRDHRSSASLELVDQGSWDQFAAAVSVCATNSAAAHHGALALPCRFHADFSILHRRFSLDIFDCVLKYLWRARRDSNS